jgi:hypothetical protein
MTVTFWTGSFLGSVPADPPLGCRPAAGPVPSGTAGPLLVLPPLTEVSGPDQRGPQLFSQYPQLRWANTLHREAQRCCPQPVGTLPPRNGQHPRAFCTRGWSAARTRGCQRRRPPRRSASAPSQTRRTESRTQGGRPSKYAYLVPRRGPAHMISSIFPGAEGLRFGDRTAKR